VPAVAVIRKKLVLFEMIGRKVFVDCKVSYYKIFRFSKNISKTFLLEFM